MKIILENKSLRVEEIESGILNLHFLTNEVDLEDYRELYESVHTTALGHLAKILIRITHSKKSSFSVETWEFITNPERDFSFIQAIAIVPRQMHLRLLARFYGRISKNVHETKIFSKEEKALEWLKKIKPKND